MTRDIPVRTLRTLARYRIFFKVSVGFVLLGVLFTAIGIAATAMQDDPAMLSSGLLLVSLGTLNAYKVVLSTARLLDGTEPSGG